VIGASQFTVQVSGKTIHVGRDIALPLRNVPVVPLEDLATAPVDHDAPLAIAIHWHGDPEYSRLRELAERIALLSTPSRLHALTPSRPVSDSDIARTLGHILEDELGLARPVLALDGIRLREFDYVDVGEVISPAGVVPVIVKSLIFAGAAHSPRGELHYRPLTEKPLQ